MMHSTTWAHFVVPCVPQVLVARGRSLRFCVDPLDPTLSATHKDCSSHAKLNVSYMTLSTLNRCDNSISRVQELFDKFDANHDGSIGSDEMIGIGFCKQ